LVAEAWIGPDKVLVAEEVAAKHGQTDMPAEVAVALEGAAKIDQP